MNAEMIARLMNPPKRKREVTSKAWAIMSNGEKVSLEGKMATIMRFEGKAGTSRRSSKGRTYRMPNGSRRYVDTAWIEDSPEIVAYVVKPA